MSTEKLTGYARRMRQEKPTPETVSATALAETLASINGIVGKMEARQAETEQRLREFVSKQLPTALCSTHNEPAEISFEASLKVSMDPFARANHRGPTDGKLCAVYVCATCEQSKLTPGVGVQTTRRFAGSKNQMVPKGVSHFNSGWDTHIFRDGDSPIWRVEAVLQGDPNNPDDSTISDVKELKVNVLNPSPGTNPYLRSVLTTDAVDGEEIIAFTMDYFAKLSNPRSFEYELRNAFLRPPLVVTLDTTQVNVAKLFLRELGKGVTHYLSFQYVFRHTFNFGSLAGLTADFSNVGCYFTAAEMIQAEGIDTSGRDGVQVPAGEWLKIAPDQSKQLNQRKQLTYEYWWAQQWSRLLYPPML